MAPKTRRTTCIPGRKVHASEFGSCKSPSGLIVRQVFPLNHSSQFWVTEYGVTFEKHRANGIFQWANGGEPIRLPGRLTPIWAIALAWTEPPDIGDQCTLRPVKIDDAAPLSASAVGWKISKSHRAPLMQTDQVPSATSCATESTWTPLRSLPIFVHADGQSERIKLTPGEYAITPTGTLRCRNNAIILPLRTHIPDKYRVALPEGSAYVDDIFSVGAYRRGEIRSSRHEKVYNCVVRAGTIDTICIRNAIGSMGNEQTIYSAVFQCMKVRPPHEIDIAFIRATTGVLTRSVCLDVMRDNPAASVAMIVAQLHESEPTWQLYAEVRIARELLRKFEFDPPDRWGSAAGEDRAGASAESHPVHA